MDSKLPWPVYNDYFDLKNADEKGNFRVDCKLCIKKKDLCISKTSASNMLRHIRVIKFLKFFKIVEYFLHENVGTKLIFLFFFFLDGASDESG